MIAASQQLTQHVREALAALHEATRAEIAERLGVQTQADLNRIRRAVDGLVEAGEVASISLNESGQPVPPFRELKYRWVGRRVNPRGEVQRKLWKFACHRYHKGQTVSVPEAAGLAGCARDYAARYYRWLWGAGYLALAARGKAGACLYRVVAGKEREAAPHWHRRAVEKVGPAALTPLAGQEHRLETGATNSMGQLAAVLEEFGQELVKLAGSPGRAAEIVQQMKDTILAVEGQGHGEPTAGHH